MSVLNVSEKMESFIGSLGKPQTAYQESILDELSGIDFPTTKNEYWKYTRLGKIANQNFSIGTSSTAPIDLEGHLVSDNFIVIENGEIRDDLSVFPDNINISAEAITGDFQVNINKGDIFSLLNEAFAKKGIRVEATKNSAREVQLLFVNSGEQLMNCNRLWIDTEQSAELEVICTYISTGLNNLTNTVCQIHVAENAKVKVHHLQNEDDTNLHVATTNAAQESNSNLHINALTLGGLLVRNNINIAVKGQNCETHMNGAVVAAGSSHVDNHTFVDHLVSNCFSNENFKYVLDDKSTGVFNGKVIVRQDAQQINAYQNNANILLTDNATVNSKPELEIYADDVKCSHGSTTGQLDDEALFYLESRGISKLAAKAMLVSAFIGEVINDLENERIESYVHSVLEKKQGWSF